MPGKTMQATFEMHRTKGMVATTLSGVATRAGVAPATVLRHFPTMTDLITACGAHVWQSLELPRPKDDELAKRALVSAGSLGHGQSRHL